MRRGTTKKLFNVLGQLIGFLVILLFAFENLHALIGFDFTGVDDILYWFAIVKQYLIYALAGLAGLELVSGKKLIAFIYFLILAFVVVSTFFPDVMDQVTGIIG